MTLYYKSLLNSNPPRPTSKSGFSRYKGKLYPSGRVSIGYTPRKKISLPDAEYERCRSKYLFAKEVKYTYPDGFSERTVLMPRTSEKARLVNHSDLSQAMEPAKRRYGLRGIQSYARRMVAEGCTLLDRAYNKRLGFYTLTCPYTDDTDVYEFNRCVSEILRQYFQILRRNLPDGIKFTYVAVLEVQPKRYEDKGQFALHIHYVCPCYLPGTWQFIFDADQLRGFWQRACNNVVGGMPDTSAAIDAVVIKKSCAGYMSKYLSKGSGNVETIAEIAPDQLPKRWWSISSVLRKALAKAIVALPCETAEYLFNQSFSSDNADIWAYVHQVHATISQSDVCVGAFGLLSQVWQNNLWLHEHVREVCVAYILCV